MGAAGGLAKPEVRMLLLVGFLTICSRRGLVTAAEADESCDASASTGSCAQAQADPPAQLQWRGYPYRVTQPHFAKKIYGGSFVVEAFKQAGFEGPMDGEGWDVLWTHRPQHDYMIANITLTPRQAARVVNHCAYFQGAGDKCKLAAVDRSLREAAPDPSISGHLRTFNLNIGKQRQEWMAALEANGHQYWLLKPCYGGDSKGIRVETAKKLLGDFRRGLELEPHLVAQEYMDRLYLGFGAKKFHMRLYVLVARTAPASVFLFSDGLVFRSKHAYEKGKKRTAKRDTFSRIGKTVDGFPLSSLWQAVDADASASVSSSEVWQRVIRVLQETFRSPVAWLSDEEIRRKDAQRGTGCFDLFGADVLLDDRLWPWVMEYNLGANMWVDERGGDNKDTLLDCKKPLMEQVTRWLALRAGSPPSSASAAAAQEEATLMNFTRLL